MKTKILNWLLFISFVVTMLAPITGIMVHKMSSLIFLILCVIHTSKEREKLNKKKYALLAVVFIAFLTGIFGMILDEIPLILALHKVISIACEFFLAVHIFVWQSKLLGVRRERGVKS